MGFKEEAKRLSAYSIPVGLIEVEDGWNCRQDYGDMSDLDSIAEVGVRVPLRGYRKGESVVLTDGHRRWAKVQELLSKGVEIAHVPFILEDRLANLGDRLLTQLVNNSGKPFTPLEQSTVLRRMYEFGWETSEISRKTGFNVQKVRDLLSLSSAEPVVVAWMGEGSVSATAAAIALRGSTPEEATELLEEVKSASPDGIATSTAVKEAKQRKAGGGTAFDPIAAANLLASLTEDDWVALPEHELARIAMKVEALFK